MNERISGDEQISPMDPSHQECAGCVSGRNLGFSSGMLVTEKTCHYITRMEELFKWQAFLTLVSTERWRRRADVHAAPSCWMRSATSEEAFGSVYTWAFEGGSCEREKSSHNGLQAF